MGLHALTFFVSAAVTNTLQHLLCGLVVVAVAAVVAAVVMVVVMLNHSSGGGQHFLSSNYAQEACSQTNFSKSIISSRLPLSTTAVSQTLSGQESTI